MPNVIKGLSVTVTDKFNVKCTYFVDALLDTGSPIIYQKQIHFIRIKDLIRRRINKVI